MASFCSKSIFKRGICTYSYPIEADSSPATQAEVPDLDEAVPERDAGGETLPSIEVFFGELPRISHSLGLGGIY